eukprot:2503539-Rhodomonas_salina.7
MTHVSCAGVLQRAEKQIDEGSEQKRRGDISLFDSTTQTALGRLAKGVCHTQPGPSQQLFQHAHVCLRDAELPESNHQRQQVGRVVGVDEVQIEDVQLGSSLAGVLDDVKKPVYLSGRVVLLLVAFLLLFEDAVLFEQAGKSVVDDGRGDLVRRPQQAYQTPMAHFRDRVLLQQESSASPTPGVLHVATLEDLVNTLQQCSREVRRHLGLVGCEGGVVCVGGVAPGRRRVPVVSPVETTLPAGQPGSAYTAATPAGEPGKGAELPLLVQRRGSYILNTKIGDQHCPPEPGALAETCWESSSAGRGCPHQCPRWHSAIPGQLACRLGC